MEKAKNNLNKYFYILLSTILMLTSSCEDTRIITENSPVDAKIGLEYLKNYYDLTYDRNYDSLFKFFHFSSKDTLIKTSRNQIETLFGEYYSLETQKLYSEKVIKGNNVSIRFKILSICKFEKGETEEILEFEFRDGKVYYLRSDINILAN